MASYHQLTIGTVVTFKGKAYEIFGEALQDDTRTSTPGMEAWDIATQEDDIVFFANDLIARWDRSRKEFVTLLGASVARDVYL